MFQVAARWGASNQSLQPRALSFSVRKFIATSQPRSPLKIGDLAPRGLSSSCLECSLAVKAPD